MSIKRHELTDREWRVLKQVLPSGRPGPVRKNDRKVMNSIFLVLCSGYTLARPVRALRPYTMSLTA